MRYWNQSLLRHELAENVCSLARLAVNRCKFIQVRRKTVSTVHRASRNGLWLHAGLMLMWTLMWIAPVVVLGDSLPPDQTSDLADDYAAADRAMANGAIAFERGDLKSAIEYWRQAATQYDQDGHTFQQIDAIRNIATALRQMGRFRLASEQLRTALDRVENLDNQAIDLNGRSQIIALSNDYGALLTLTQQHKLAKTYLKRALALAQQDDDHRAQALVLNNQGNLLLSQELYQKAIDTYQQAADLANQSDDRLLQARALTNAAKAASVADLDSHTATDFNQQAMNLIEGLPATRDKTYLLLAVGQVAMDENRSMTSANGLDGSDRADMHHDDTVRRAFDAYRRAYDNAREINDTTGEALALSQLGQLYKRVGRWEDAIRFTEERDPGRWRYRRTRCVVPLAVATRSIAA